MSAFLHDDPNNVDALILWGNATARLRDSTAALYGLADVIHDKTLFDAARRTLRSSVSSTDDAAAEGAFRKAAGLAMARTDSPAFRKRLGFFPAPTEAQLALANFLWVTGRPDESDALLRAAADQVPGHPLVNYVLGRFFLSRHRGNEAEHYLKNAAAAGAYGHSARLALVDYYVEKNRHAEARAILDSMSEADDASGDVSVRLAVDDARLGKSVEAVRRLDRLLARAPANPRARLIKAQVLLAKGNLDRRFAKAAVTADPESIDARMLLGQVLSAAGDMDGAVGEYLEAARRNPDAVPPRLALARLLLALERGPEALQYAKDAVRLAPDDQAAVLALVKAFILRADYAAAELALKPLLSRSSDVADVVVQAGTIQAARGNDGAARAAFARTLELDPESLDALSGLVSLDLKGRLSADTQRRVEAAVAARPRDPKFLLLAAKLHEAAHDQVRTEAALRQAFAIDMGSVKAGQALVDFLTRERRLDEAVAVLRQMVDQRPPSLNVQTTLAILLEDTGHPTDARALYEKILGQEPETAMVSYRLARLYMADPNKLDLALDLARTAQKQLPADAGVNDVVGWIETLKSQPERGLASLREAVRADPDNALYHYHLGSALQRDGNLVRARDEFRKALEIDGKFPGADEARRLVEAMR
jgi:protein O-GlcNAc transferase